MSYRLAGRSTDFCNCDAPCPCAFGQEPSSGTCKSVICFDIRQGEADGLDLSGTRAVLIATFDGLWTGGNFTAALVLDENASEEQRAALAGIFGGRFGGDAAALAELIGDMRGVVTAPITYGAGSGAVTVRAGDVAAGAGRTLRNVDDTAEIQVINAHYPLATVTAGRSTKVMANLPGLEYDLDGSGFWTGPFEFEG